MLIREINKLNEDKPDNEKPQNHFQVNSYDTRRLQTVSKDHLNLQQPSKELEYVKYEKQNYKNVSNNNSNNIDGMLNDHRIFNSPYHDKSNNAYFNSLRRDENTRGIRDNCSVEEDELLDDGEDTLASKYDGYRMNRVPSGLNNEKMSSEFLLGRYADIGIERMIVGAKKNTQTNNVQQKKRMIGRQVDNSPSPGHNQDFRTHNFNNHNFILGSALKNIQQQNFSQGENIRGNDNFNH
jgi:hypothetical protein